MPEEEYQRLKTEITEDILNRLHPILSQIPTKDDLKEFREQMEPAAKIFSNVNGFFNISKWILLGLATLGAGLGGLYLLVEEVKKFFKAH